jgi:exonuclease III
MKILTYNANLKLYMRTERLRTILKNAKYDIICLQGLFRSRFLPGPEPEKLRPENMFAAFPPKSKSLFFVTCDSGLAIFSTRQILLSRFLPFSRAAGTDRVIEKGILYACIRITKHKHFHVFNTQLQLGNSKKKKLIRAAQLEELYTFIEQLAGEDDSTIVLCGDFHHKLSNIPLFRDSSMYTGHTPTHGKRCSGYICIQKNSRLMAGNTSIHPFENLSDYQALELLMRTKTAKK